MKSGSPYVSYYYLPFFINHKLNSLDYLQEQAHSFIQIKLDTELIGRITFSKDSSNLCTVGSQ